MKSIAGYEGLYSADESGKIYSHKSNRFLSTGRSDSYWGYVNVTLFKDGVGKQFPLHRLIASIFIPNPDELPIVNHKDGNKKNNSVENLEWCTQKQNVQHCIEMGTFGKMNRTRWKREQAN